MALLKFPEEIGKVNNNNLERLYYLHRLRDRIDQQIEAAERAFTEADPKPASKPQPPLAKTPYPSTLKSSIV